MQIVKNTIVFANHTIVLERATYKLFSAADAADYMNDVATCLSPKGSAAKHLKELADINNDGSWSVVENAKATPKVTKRCAVDSKVGTIKFSLNKKATKLRVACKGKPTFILNWIEGKWYAAQPGVKAAFVKPHADAKRVYARAVKAAWA